MVEQPGGTGVDGVQSATSCSPRLYSSLLMAASHSFAWGEDFVLKCSVLELMPVEVLVHSYSSDVQRDVFKLV